VTLRTPVPDSETVCGLLEALSVMVSVPEALPVAVGAKMTLMVQVPFGTTVGLAQLLA